MSNNRIERTNGTYFITDSPIKTKPVGIGTIVERTFKAYGKKVPRDTILTTIMAFMAGLEYAHEPENLLKVDSEIKECFRLMAAYGLQKEEKLSGEPTAED